MFKLWDVFRLSNYRNIIMYIYKTTNKLNGKIYIGLSKYAPHENPEYLGSGFLLKKAVECYGRENFIKTIIEECNTPEHLMERERYWISTLKSNVRGVGYNICEGGAWGDNWTNHPRQEELRQHFSGITKGTHNPNYGNRWTPEQKERASKRAKDNAYGIDPNTGESISKRSDIRKKISETKLGLKNPRACLWKLISPVGDEFLIEGGIRHKIKHYGLEYQQFQKRQGIKKADGSIQNHKGWSLYKLQKPL